VEYLRKYATGCAYRTKGSTGGAYRIPDARLLPITPDLLARWGFTMASGIALGNAITTILVVAVSERCVVNADR